MKEKTTDVHGHVIFYTVSFSCLCHSHHRIFFFHLFPLTWVEANDRPWTLSSALLLFAPPWRVASIIPLHRSPWTGAGDLRGRRREHHADRQPAERDWVQRQGHRLLHHRIQRGPFRTGQDLWVLPLFPSFSPLNGSQLCSSQIPASACLISTQNKRTINETSKKSSDSITGLLLSLHNYSE